MVLLLLMVDKQHVFLSLIIYNGKNFQVENKDGPQFWKFYQTYVMSAGIFVVLQNLRKNSELAINTVIISPLSHRPADVCEFVK